MHEFTHVNKFSLFCAFFLSHFYRGHKLLCALCRRFNINFTFVWTTFQINNITLNNTFFILNAELTLSIRTFTKSAHSLLYLWAVFRIITDIYRYFMMIRISRKIWTIEKSLSKLKAISSHLCQIDPAVTLPSGSECKVRQLYDYWINFIFINLKINVMYNLEILTFYLKF